MKNWQLKKKKDLTAPDLRTAPRHPHKLLNADAALIDSTTASGATALHMAFHGGDPDVVGLLLAWNADVNALDRRGRSPLTVACGRMYGGVV